MKKTFVIFLSIILTFSFLAGLRPIGKADGAVSHAKLYNKTFADVIAFLSRDTTNELTYNIYTFTCVQFSETLIQNAQAQGFLAFPIEAVYSSKDTVAPGVTFDGHVFVGIATVDEGIVYVEPQRDWIYSLQFPGQLCSTNHLHCMSEKVASYIWFYKNPNPASIYPLFENFDFHEPSN